MSKSPGIPYWRVYSDETGESHMDRREMRLRPSVVSLEIPAVEAGEPIAASQSLVLRVPPGWEADWHPAPAYQYFYILRGTVEIEVTDGDHRQIPAGEFVLLQDITGKGHRTRAVGEEELLVAIVQLA